MSGRTNVRWRLWIPLLLVAGSLALFGDKTPSNGVAQTKRAEHPGPAITTTRAPSAAVRTKADDLPAEITSLRDRAELIPLRSKSQPVRDLFAPSTWAPLPPAPVAKMAPSVDTTPPLPSLTFIGKKHEAGTWEVYLSQGTHTLIAREGATLEGDLRVERIAPPDMTLTQLSTGRSMTLGIGDAQ